MNLSLLGSTILLLMLFLECHSAKNQLEELEKVLEAQKLVAILFSKPCCTCVDCVEAEAMLSAINLDIMKDYNIVSVKLIDEKKLASSYGIKEFPALVFLRDRKPVIYEGKYDRDELLNWFENSRESTLKELDDSSFEHLTQAATGATTGDWLVAFYGKSCDTPSISMALDSVGVKVKSRVNIAKVNIDTSPVLKDRFGISSCPQILFFRLGKMYEYSLPGLKTGSLISFVEGFYRNSKGVPVPKEKSPFEILVEKSVLYIQKNKTVAFAGIGGFLLLLALLLLCSTKQSKEKLTKKE